MTRFVYKALLIVALVLGGAVQAANPVGEVVFVQGLTTAQQGEEAPRFLIKGDILNQGDVITTTSRGYAIIALRDGTRMTLRPGTSFAVDRLVQGGAEEGLAMRLLRGGLRAITGSIGKRNPNAVAISAYTATIGVRGTNFDARICTTDCRQEAQRLAPAAVPVATEVVVARVGLIHGAAEAISAEGQPRSLSKGAPLYNGDTVRTSAAAYVLLAFRDRSKITVTPSSEFKLEEVRFEPGHPEAGSFITRLTRGGFRALTGLLGHKSPQAVQFRTTTAWIGVRGTGVDAAYGLNCPDGGGAGLNAGVPEPKATTPTKPKPKPGASAKVQTPVKAGGGNARCSNESVYAYTWEGSVGLQADSQEVVMEAGRAAVFNPKVGIPVLLSEVPRFLLEQEAPRPDQVDVDFDYLFTTVHLEDYLPGLYVGMRDGYINLAASGGDVDLGRNEAGVLFTGTDRPLRIEPIPVFMTNDPYPTPEPGNEKDVAFIELSGLGPFGEICEVR